MGRRNACAKFNSRESESLQTTESAMVRSLERDSLLMDRVERLMPDYKLTPPTVGILIDLFEPRGRDFGQAPHINMRVKIERITSSYRNEQLNAWQADTKPVGSITIAPDGGLRFSSKRLQSEMGLGAGNA